MAEAGEVTAGEARDGVLDGALDDTKKAAWRLFLTARARLLDRIDRDLAAAGVLPWDWYDVLLTLEEAEGGTLRMGQLADAVLVSRSGLTRLVDRLEAAGYLRRAHSSTDRRAIDVTITEAGLRERERTWPAYRDAIARHFARFLGPQEARSMAAAFRRMLDNDSGG